MHAPGCTFGSFFLLSGFRLFKYYFTRIPLADDKECQQQEHDGKSELNRHGDKRRPRTSTGA